MNRKNTPLAFAAIVAAGAITGVALAVPQQALTEGTHHNHVNSIKVDQQTDQANVCTNSSFCLNDGSNDAEVHR
jgi:hypothetical protein